MTDVVVEAQVAMEPRWLWDPQGPPCNEVNVWDLTHVYFAGGMGKQSCVWTLRIIQTSLNPFPVQKEWYSRGDGDTTYDVTNGTPSTIKKRKPFVAPLTARNQQQKCEKKMVSQGVARPSWRLEIFTYGFQYIPVRLCERIQAVADTFHRRDARLLRWPMSTTFLIPETNHVVRLDIEIMSVLLRIEFLTFTFYRASVRFFVLPRCLKHDVELWWHGMIQIWDWLGWWSWIRVLWFGIKLKQFVKPNQRCASGIATCDDPYDPCLSLGILIQR